MEDIFKKMVQKLEEKFETILEQKNLIINEFREKIELLNDKISILNKLKYYEDLQKADIYRIRIKILQKRRQTQVNKLNCNNQQLLIQIKYLMH